MRLIDAESSELDSILYDRMFTSDYICALREIMKIEPVNIAEKIKEAIEGVTWYHLSDNGILVEGASGVRDALYKAEDIFAVLDKFVSECEAE